MGALLDFDMHSTRRCLSRAIYATLLDELIAVRIFTQQRIDSRRTGSVCILFLLPKQPPLLALQPQAVDNLDRSAKTDKPSLRGGARHPGVARLLPAAQMAGHHLQLHCGNLVSCLPLQALHGLDVRYLDCATCTQLRVLLRDHRLDTRYGVLLFLG